MGVPSVKTIKSRLEWLDKTNLGENRAATIVRQAMEWAETGEVGRTFGEYYESLSMPGVYQYRDLDDYRNYGDRVSMALRIMDEALETFGVEGIQGRSMYGHDSLEYLNTGDTYTATVIYDHKSGTWKITSWGDIVEAYPSRFPY